MHHHPEPQAAGRAGTPTPRTGDLGKQLADDLGRFGQFPQAAPAAPQAHSPPCSSTYPPYPPQAVLPPAHPLPRAPHVATRRSTCSWPEERRHLSLPAPPTQGPGGAGASPCPAGPRPLRGPCVPAPPYLTWAPGHPQRPQITPVWTGHTCTARPDDPVLGGAGHWQHGWAVTVLGMILEPSSGRQQD